LVQRDNEESPGGWWWWLLAASCCWCRESVLADEGEQFLFLSFFLSLYFFVTSPHEMWSIKTENDKKKATIHQQESLSSGNIFSELGYVEVVDENKRRDHVRVVANERFHGHHRQNRLCATKQLIAPL
jgi:hypothetical protein